MHGWERLIFLCTAKNTLFPFFVNNAFLLSNFVIIPLITQWQSSTDITALEGCDCRCCCPNLGQTPIQPFQGSVPTPREHLEIGNVTQSLLTRGREHHHSEQGTFPPPEDNSIGIMTTSEWSTDNLERSEHLKFRIAHTTHNEKDKFDGRARLERYFPCVLPNPEKRFQWRRPVFGVGFQ